MTRRGLQAIVSRLQQGKASVGDWQAMFKVREPQNRPAQPSLPNIIVRAAECVRRRTAAYGG